MRSLIPIITSVIPEDTRSGTPVNNTPVLFQLFLLMVFIFSHKFTVSTCCFLVLKVPQEKWKRFLSSCFWSFHPVFKPDLIGWDFGMGDTGIARGTSET